MEVIDPGHKYILNNIDGLGRQVLTFVKRMGDKYPRNYSAYEGTQTQEVLRALIDRCKYVNDQVPCAETQSCLELFRSALLLLELRAARQRKEMLNIDRLADIESLEPCLECGHILCAKHVRWSR